MARAKGLTPGISQPPSLSQRGHVEFLSTGRLRIDRCTTSELRKQSYLFILTY